MYLVPGSGLQNSLVQTSDLPDSMRSLQLQGFTPLILKADQYLHLCQHYSHDEVDVYIYDIQTSRYVELFALGTVQKWVLGYLKVGSIDCTFYGDTRLGLSAKSVSFFPTQSGKQIHFRLESGDYKFYCCCFKSGFEHYLRLNFPSLFTQFSLYPLAISSIDLPFQYEWDELVHFKSNDPIFSVFVAARIRLLLAKFCLTYQSRKTYLWLQQEHPGVHIHTIEKAYQAKDYIMSRLGEALHLKFIARACTWNLQGLKIGFTQVFGQSPHQFIVEQRLRLAHDLIAMEPDSSIQSIASRCGYKRTHHFIKVFKNKFGSTPGELRRKYWQ